MAKAAGVSAADVNITLIGTMGSPNGRRLLTETIRVDTSINSYSEAAANSMAKALTPDRINGELAKVGLPKATLLVTPKVSAGNANPSTRNPKVAGGGVNAKTLTLKPESRWR